MASYNPIIYKEQGGSRQVVGSGGSLDVESGGEIDIESGGSLKLAGTAVSSTAAELNILDGVTATAAEINQLDNADRMETCVKVALAADDSAAGLFSWQNTEESSDILVTKLIVQTTTATSGACTGDFGFAATSILSDTLIDGADLNAAVGVFDTFKDGGTNGVGSQLVADDEFVTGSVATGASAGIVGNAYIFYVVV